MKINRVPGIIAIFGNNDKFTLQITLKKAEGLTRASGLTIVEFSTVCVTFFVSLQQILIFLQTACGI
jgi:hypothetical protein